MKSLLALIAVAAGPLLQAQIPPQFPEEARIQAALAKLWTDDSIFLELNGSETIAGNTTRMKTQIWWKSEFDGTGRQTVRMQVLQHQNDVLVQRIVGNGDALYNYNVRSHEYSVSQYGGFGGTRPEFYVRDLLNFSNMVAKGQDAWGTKMLRELFGLGRESYRSWMPGIRPSELPDGRYEDPVWNERAYVTNPTTDYLLYNGSPRRSIAFELVDDPPSDVYRLSAIYFAERGKVGNKNRLVEWQLKPYKLIEVDYRDFTPYNRDELRGWRPVVGPAPVKTG